MKRHTIYAYVWSADNRTFFYVGKTVRDVNRRSIVGSYKKTVLNKWLELLGWTTQDLRDHRVILETDAPGSHESLWVSKLQTIHPDWTPINGQWSLCVSDTPEESLAHQRALAVANVKKQYANNTEFREKVKKQSAENSAIYNEYCKQKFGCSYTHARKKFGVLLRKDSDFIAFKNSKC